MIDEKDILINNISKQDKEFLEALDLKIVSINEPISEENKNECYIIEEYKRPYTPDGVNIIKSMHLVKITDFKWKNQNSIHLVLQKSLPEDRVFTGIEIKYPKSMLFGNIKCWGNVNGVYSYPSSIVENASLVSLLSMPIETNLNVRIFQYWFTESFLPWSIAKNYIQGKDILDLINKNGLEKVLLNYLTYRYNYDRKFQGAKYDEKGNPTNKAAELRQKFEGQKPEDVIDGLFKNWKLDNPTLINDNVVKIFKQIIYMLSNYTYSKYAINKGYNDDIKLFSPYYFELMSNPTEQEVEYWEFKDCLLQLKSLYFDFFKSTINVKNKNISENPVYQLEANYFNWLSITNKLETNNIPSLIPAEIKLSDGEYGKYLTSLIVSNGKIEEYLNYFSQLYRLLYSKTVWTSMTKNLVEDSIKITFYKHEKLFNLNQIEVFGIWGYGKYDITIFTKKEQIIINNLELFNKNNEILSLITLEI